MRSNRHGFVAGLRRHVVAIILLVTFVVSCAAPVVSGSSTTPPEPGSPSTTPAPTGTTTQGAIAPPETGERPREAELLSASDGELLLAWLSPGSDGQDVWLSVLEGSTFGEAVKVSDVGAADVPLDEFRPALAYHQGKVAVAWTTHHHDVRVALSGDLGRTFDPSLPLNGDSGDAMQVLPVIAFDTAGTLHAVWIDPREAPSGAEEPADLYHARVTMDTVHETNLTSGQSESVCGCCRPSIEMGSDSFVVTFRNTTADGYRDPFQMRVALDGSAFGPTPSSPPVWKIEACPVAGPVGFGSTVLWLDGSAGHHRLLVSSGTQDPPEVLLETGDGLRITAAPRKVTGVEMPMVLVPGNPTGRLVAFEDGEWRVTSLDIPAWATTAAIHDGKLILAGISNGALAVEVQPLP